MKNDASEDVKSANSTNNPVQQIHCKRDCVNHKLHIHFLADCSGLHERARSVGR